MLRSLAVRYPRSGSGGLSPGCMLLRPSVQGHTAPMLAVMRGSGQARLPSVLRVCSHGTVPRRFWPLTGMLSVTMTVL